MYQMPGEVLQGERPGLFGLNLYQVVAVLGALFLGSSLFGNNLLGYLASGVVGILLARRTRGLYAFQYLGYIIVWVIGNVTKSQSALLDPAELYAIETRDEQRGKMYVVRWPSGETVTIQT
jgi:hypothetical protein